MTDHDEFLDELRRRADRVHTYTPEAAVPPPGIWQQVLAATQPQTELKEQSEMIMQPALATPTGVPAQSTNPRYISRVVNMAASLLVVAAIAMSGWFAAMNLQPGGNNTNGIAFAPGTPAAVGSTCDVEPLTVDEVMQIVRNPYRHLYERVDPDLPGRDGAEFAARAELMEGFLYPDREDFYSVQRGTPSGQTFAAASDAANRYISCLPTATYGHLWAMIDPVWVQMVILGRYPVFANEADVLAYVTEAIDQPIDGMYDPSSVLYAAYGDIHITANPDIERANTVLTSDTTYQPLVAQGILVTDANGEVVMETDAHGFPHQLRSGAIPQRPVVVVGKSTVTGEWYVLPWLGN